MGRRGVHSPDGEHQERRERHPGQVRDHQKAGDGRSPPKSAHRKKNGKPECHTVRKAERRRFQAEEEPCPTAIQKELHEKENQGPRPPLPLPVQPRRDPHHEIKKAPDRTENPVRRSPRGLSQRCEPCARTEVGSRQSWNKTQEDERGERQIIGFHEVAKGSLFRGRKDWRTSLTGRTRACLIY